MSDRFPFNVGGGISTILEDLGLSHGCYCEGKMKYRIWLEEIPAERGNPVVPGGWFICQGSRQNEYIYDRCDDSSDDRIRYYANQAAVAMEMRRMRSFGYGCKSDPSFTVTEEF